MNPDWRAGYLAGRAGQPPVLPPKIADADAWRDGDANRTTTWKAPMTDPMILGELIRLAFALRRS
jgi:hypothetical protein